MICIDKGQQATNLPTDESTLKERGVVCILKGRQSMNLPSHESTLKERGVVCIDKGQQSANILSKDDKGSVFDYTIRRTMELN